MLALVTHRNGDLYSCCTSQGIVAVNTSYEALADLLVEFVEGITLEQAYEMLDNPAPPDVWRATLSSATASGILSLEEQTEALAAAADSELVSIKERLESVVKERDKAKEIESLRQSIREIESDVREALIRQFGPTYNPYWISWATRFERERLAELEEVND